MRKALDLLQLGRLTGGYRIFLRYKYDRLDGWFRRVATVYRRTLLRRTCITVVVGSLGKTTTRRAVQAVLACPERNFSYSNYGTSVAENVLRVRPWDAHAVIEVGVAGPNRMHPYPPLIRPDIVVVTSIKSEHNRSFPTLFDTRTEKVKMVATLPATGLAILNGDDPHVRWMATQTRARVIFFGQQPDNDVRATDVVFGDQGGTTFTLAIGAVRLKLRSSLAGEHMLYPALAACAVAHAEKIEPELLAARLAALEPETSRMQWLTLPGDIRVLDDSYKAAWESIQAAFETVARLPAKRKIVVLGHVEEPPGKERDVYRDLGARAAGFADLVICVGRDSMTAFRAAAKKAGMDAQKIKLVGSRLDAVAELLRATLQPGDLVLVKGASTQRLRRLTLDLLGQPVRCRVKYCGVKVKSCDACPLLNRPAAWWKNYYIRRYVRP
jgi:UDP-N-acetylmuramyl pentapeptide synthase